MEDHHVGDSRGELVATLPHENTKVFREGQGSEFRGMISIFKFVDCMLLRTGTGSKLSRLSSIFVT